MILDSNGRFEKLWEFSAHLMQKSFKILEVSKEEGFDEGNILKCESSNKIILRSVGKGKVESVNGKVEIKGLHYTVK